MAASPRTLPEPCFEDDDEDVDAFDPTVSQPRIVLPPPRGMLLIAGMLVAFIWLPAFAAAALVALH